jgi:CDGSH-type Zn-finger protein/uncharacterized Fe-S cluster protein YjdI
MTITTDLAVRDREELIYLLTEAAEFEHTVMCSYLYAQWTLKRDESEGVTARELEAIERWRSLIASVSMEEMLHLALVNNLLAAVGAAPHFSRPDFPVARGKFPAEVDFHLAPFNESSIDHFVFLERPDGIDIEDGKGFSHESRYPRVVCTSLLSPTPRDYSSQGHLYHGIGRAIERLADKLGEENLFVGHGQAQLSATEFPMPGLFQVTDVESAHQALEEIVRQGEGAPAHREDSHYARFAAIRDEYAQLRSARTRFEPAHPAAVNPVLAEIVSGSQVARVTNPLAKLLVDLGNSVYGLMVHVLAQVCAPSPLPSRLRAGLSEASSELMKLMTVIGENCARTPIGDEYPGTNAGITFSLPRSFGQLVQANAALILAERARELAVPAGELDDHLPGVGERLNRLEVDLVRLHRECEQHFVISVETPPTESKPSEPAPAFCSLDSINQASTDALTIYFDPKRCIHSRQCVLNAPDVFLANVEGPWLHPENDSVEHLVHVALSCPSGAITYSRHDGGEEEPVPKVNYLFIRENGPYAVNARLEIDREPPVNRATLCRCGHSKNKPYCDNSHIQARFEASGEPTTVDSNPLRERGGALHLKPIVDGPLALRGPVEICCGTGRTVIRTESTLLCRCGASGNKPFCDGSHKKTGFRSGSESSD